MRAERQMTNGGARASGLIAAGASTGASTGTGGPSFAIALDAASPSVTDPDPGGRLVPLTARPGAARLPSARLSPTNTDGRNSEPTTPRRSMAKSEPLRRTGETGNDPAEAKAGTIPSAAPAGPVGPEPATVPLPTPMPSPEWAAAGVGPIPSGERSSSATTTPADTDDESGAASVGATVLGRDGANARRGRLGSPSFQSAADADGLADIAPTQAPAGAALHDCPNEQAATRKHPGATTGPASTAGRSGGEVGAAGAPASELLLTMTGATGASVSGTTSGIQAPAAGPLPTVDRRTSPNTTRETRASHDPEGRAERDPTTSADPSAAGPAAITAQASAAGTFVVSPEPHMVDFESGFRAEHSIPLSPGSEFSSDKTLAAADPATPDIIGEDKPAPLAGRAEVSFGGQQPDAVAVRVSLAALGTLEVRLASGEDGRSTQVTVTADQADTLRAVMTDHRELHAMLDQAGIEGDRAVRYELSDAASTRDPSGSSMNPNDGAGSGSGPGSGRRDGWHQVSGDDIRRAGDAGEASRTIRLQHDAGGGTAINITA